MVVGFFSRLFTLYAMDDGGVIEKDPYHAIAHAFALNKSVVYLFGQLSQKRMTQALYIDLGENLVARGYTHFIYFANQHRKALGGKPLHKLLPGFWLVTL